MEIVLIYSHRQEEVQDTVVKILAFGIEIFLFKIHYLI